MLYSGYQQSGLNNIRDLYNPVERLSYYLNMHKLRALNSALLFYPLNVEIFPAHQLD